MQFWMEFFSIVAAIALVVQVAILIGCFCSSRAPRNPLIKWSAICTRAWDRFLRARRSLLDDTQPKIANLVEDASHIVYLARGQAQKMDKVFTKLPIVCAASLFACDRILTGTLETVEDAGFAVRRTFWDRCRKLPRWCRESRLASMFCARAAETRNMFANN